MIPFFDYDLPEIEELEKKYNGEQLHYTDRTYHTVCFNSSFIAQELIKLRQRENELIFKITGKEVTDKKETISNKVLKEFKDKESVKEYRQITRNISRLENLQQHSKKNKTFYYSLNDKGGAITNTFQFPSLDNDYILKLINENSEFYTHSTNYYFFEFMKSEIISEVYVVKNEEDRRKIRELIARTVTLFSTTENEYCEKEEEHYREDENRGDFGVFDIFNNLSYLFILDKLYIVRARLTDKIMRERREEYKQILKNKGFHSYYTKKQLDRIDKELELISFIESKFTDTLSQFKKVYEVKEEGTVKSDFYGRVW